MQTNPNLNLHCLIQVSRIENEVDFETVLEHMSTTRLVFAFINIYRGPRLIRSLLFCPLTALTEEQTF